MTRFFFRVWIAFSALKAVSLAAHYLGPSPWGGPLVLRPDRFLPDALLVEVGLLGVLCALASVPDARLRAGWRRAWRAVGLFGLALLTLLAQVDLEIVRWIGQHITLSYLANFAGARDPALTARIISGDPVFVGLGLALGLSGVPVGALAWRLWARDDARFGVARGCAVFAVGIALVSAPAWVRPSEKRWRRIRPVALSLAHDVAIGVSGAERPRDPAQARADLLSLVAHGAVNAAGSPMARALPGAEPEFPLWRDTGVGALDPQRFAAQPLSDRPDIILIVFETMRGWNTGQVPHPDLRVGTPRVNAFMRDRATVVPYMHSTGFPSVEGCMAMHLGIWPHFRKIIFSDYLHIRTRGFPELLRAAGYHTRALLGADPSFSNFTPWMQRWYDAFEYVPGVHHDGPLVDRFLEIYEETRADAPRMLMIWTATTHPPYDIPPSEGVPAAESEARYDQALAYADREVARLLETLAAQPEWSRTVVFLLGDHAQPAPDQWLYPDRVGPLNPGHTWTHLYITGGWPRLPSPRRIDVDASHVDLAPTILGALDLRVAHHFMGVNLLAVREGAATRPAVAFRYGDIAWLEGARRAHFRLDSGGISVWAIDRGDALSYGLLRPASVTPQHEAPPEWPVERWRDAIRAYGALLDGDALMPPE